MPRGTIYGCLGPNGAGKTTAVRMLCGTLSPTAGEAYVMGRSMSREATEAKKGLSLVPDRPAVSDTLCAREYLEFVGTAYRISRHAIAKRTPELLKLFGLYDKREQQLGSLSQGQKQKCTLAAALLPRPEVLFLDEPTVAVDIATSSLIHKLLRNLADRGYTVFITTHDFLFAEVVCDRIGIIHDHRLVAEGTLDELRDGAPHREGDSLEDVFMALTGMSNHYEPLSFFEDLTQISNDEDQADSTASKGSIQEPQADADKSPSNSDTEGEHSRSGDSDEDGQVRARAEDAASDTTPGGARASTLLRGLRLATSPRRWIPALRARFLVLDLFCQLYLRVWWRQTMLQSTPDKDPDALRKSGRPSERDDGRYRLFGIRIPWLGRFGGDQDSEGTQPLDGSGNGNVVPYLILFAMLVGLISVFLLSLQLFSRVPAETWPGSADGGGAQALAVTANLACLALLAWSLRDVIETMFLSKTLGLLEGLPLTEGQTFGFAFGAAAFNAGSMTGLVVLAVFAGYGASTIPHILDLALWQLPGMLLSQLLYYPLAVLAAVFVVVIVVGAVAVIGVLTMALVSVERIMTALMVLLVGSGIIGSFAYERFFPEMGQRQTWAGILDGMNASAESLPGILGAMKGLGYFLARLVAPIFESAAWQAPPGGWIARMLSGMATIAPLSLLAGLLPLAVVSVGCIFASRKMAAIFYEHGFRKVQAPTSLVRTRWFFSGTLRLTGLKREKQRTYLSAPVAAAFTKELTSYIRDYGRAFGLAGLLLAFASGISLIAFQLPTFIEQTIPSAAQAGPVDYATRAYDQRSLTMSHVTMSVVLLPYAIAVLLTMVLTSSVGKHCVGLEGRGYAIWAAAPTSTAQLLWGKWLAVFLFGGLSGICLQLVVFFFSGPRFGLGLILGVVGCLVAAACSGFSTVGMSARYARLDHPEPQRATTRRGNLLAGTPQIVIVVLGVPIFWCCGEAYQLGVPLWPALAAFPVAWSAVGLSIGVGVLLWGARGLQQLAW